MGVVVEKIGTLLFTRCGKVVNFVGRCREPSVVKHGSKLTPNYLVELSTKPTIAHIKHRNALKLAWVWLWIFLKETWCKWCSTK